MSRASFRVKLTLWNGAVMAIVLGAFGLGIVYAAQARLAAAVDKELQDRGRRFAQRADLGRDGGPQRPEPGSGSLGGSGRSEGAGQGRSPQTGRGGRPDGEGSGSPGPNGEGQRGSPYRPFGVQSPGFDPQTERIAAVRRPRFLDSNGRGLGPNGLGPWDQASFEAALKGRQTFATVVAEGQRIRVLSVPWRHPDRPAGVIQVARELADVEEGWGRQVATLATLLPIALLIAGLGSLFLTGRALRPVRAVTHAAASLGAKDLSRRLEVEGKDELAELAETFNGMIARLQESFERQRRFTADASHELRTPLTRIKLATSSALEGDPDLERFAHALSVSDKAADAMARLVHQLLLLARADGGRLELKLETTDLGVLAEDALASVPGAATRCSGAELPGGRVSAQVDAAMMQSVLANVLENAVRHTPEEGQITVTVSQDGADAILEVRDTGEGIPAEHLPHLTERFYRVDEARSRSDGGCGLGLAITRGLVEAHGGNLTIESEPGVGTSVRIVIPVERPPEV